ncbi:MAG TPA: hypothetical protein EYP49_06420 [Anaerolineae bacterium]|nr:hypothetical protein [Anaerolineae bacterium]
MNFTGILIGTGILWGLTVLVVLPVARLIQRHWLAAAFSVTSQKQSDDGVKALFGGSISPTAFMIADVIVLGVAGFLLGLTTGWWFLGLAFQRYHWPGLLAFVGASWLGTQVAR